jgi:hypothetical protein
MTRTFVTNCRYDAVAYTDYLRKYLETHDGATFDDAPSGAARPGVIRLSRDGKDIEIRFPTYDSGHEVTIGAPREFGDDVAEWLTTTGASRP